MTVKLYVNWRNREILTSQQLNERIEGDVNARLNDEYCQNEDIEDYLDRNYTKLELYNILASGKETTISGTLISIKHDVEREVRDWVEEDVRRQFEVINIEV